jgi:hypothetical protein
MATAISIGYVVTPEKRPAQDEQPGIYEETLPWTIQKKVEST